MTNAEYLTHIILFDVDTFERDVPQNLNGRMYEDWDRFWNDIESLTGRKGSDDIRVFTLEDFVEFVNDEHSIENDWSAYIMMRE